MSERWEDYCDIDIVILQYLYCDIDIVILTYHHVQVKTWRMNLYTLFQFVGLATLWVVKSTKAALAFPFFVVAMIPYRMSLNWVFSEKELSAVNSYFAVIYQVKYNLTIPICF